MTLEFTIPGAPKGKQRPRVCRINGRSITYTPKQTVEYENQIRSIYFKVANFKFERHIPLEIAILALFELPKNVSKKVRALMLNGEILPTKRPDGDNIIKIVLDALNGLVYHDDAQICKINFTKKYAEKPETKVLIKTIEGT